MNSVLVAECENGEITFQGTRIQPAQILSKGDGQSSGLLVIQGGEVFYIASSFQDVSDTIDKVKEAVDKLGEILSSIGSSMTGSTTAPPPTLASDLAELASIGTELTALKETLR